MNGYEPKTDCFAYSYSEKTPKCKALNELYCLKENCRFYKPKKEEEK